MTDKALVANMVCPLCARMHGRPHADGCPGSGDYPGLYGEGWVAARDSLLPPLADAVLAAQAERDKWIAEIDTREERYFRMCLRLDAAETRTVALREIREAAKHAKGLAAAPDYDEEAIRDALWAVVAAVLDASAEESP